MHAPAELIARALGLAPPLRLTRLSGGCIAEVYRADFAPGVHAPVVAKLDTASPTPALDREAFMLRYLAEHSELPVPCVLAASPTILVLEYIDAPDRITPASQRHAAELLADLHSIAPPPPDAARFGLDRDTLIGPLEQPNPWTESWVTFFRDHRLLHMTAGAHRSGNLPAPLGARLEHLAARLGELIDEPPRPSLIHGDAWSGNILCRDGRVAAFIDPAIAYAHPEQELAFTTLFSTFGPPFFERYRELRPIPPGFDDGPRPRRDVYNLYPLLVHVALFGGHYPADLDSTLRRLGF